jgi:hypothetical protein
MRKSSWAALAAVALVIPLTICADEPAVAEPEMETVMVTGEQPGPGLWKVSRDGHVMWVFGSILEVPDTIRWRTQEAEARIAESEELLLPGWPRVKLDIGVFEGLTLVPSALKAARNPDGARLKDLLEPEAYAAWLRLRAKYLDDDEDTEKYRPSVAEEKLWNAIGKRNRKRMDHNYVLPVIEKLASKHKVRVNELPPVVRKMEVEKPRAIIKAARKLDLAEGACVGRNLLKIDQAEQKGLLAYNAASEVARINAWATGDVEALRARSGAEDETLKREDCLTAALDDVLKQDESEQTAEVRRGYGIIKQQDELYAIASKESRNNWIAAAEAALASNSSTFAVLPINLVVESYSWVAELAHKGYAVEGPDGKPLQVR